MPKEEIKLNVFVASPSDVKKERNILQNICDELNTIWGDVLGLNLNLLRWEKNTYPTISEYPQNAINEQIGDNYDIFIALFWNRFGTPTKVDSSGTEEEFNRALAKYKNDNDSIDIMVYFKNQTIDAHNDKKQQELIQDFKKRLPTTGAYYWSYKRTKNFEPLIRSHLSFIAQKWAKKYSLFKNIDFEDKKIDTLKFELDEYYFLISGKAGILTQTQQGIASIFELYINKDIQFRDLIKSLLETKKHNKINTYFDLYSEILADITTNLNFQIKIMSNKRNDFFNLLSKAILIELTLHSSPRLSGIKKFISPWKESAKESYQEIEQLYELINRFPEQTILFAKSKKNILYAVDKYKQEVETIERISSSILQMVDDHI